MHKKTKTNPRGAGRKPLGKVRLFSQVEEETYKNLCYLSGGNRGIGKILDQYFGTKDGLKQVVLSYAKINPLKIAASQVVAPEKITPKLKY